MTLAFDIKFAKPRLQFKDTTASVSLTFDISGHFTVDSTDVEDFPNGLCLELNTSLVNVQGTWDPSHPTSFVPQANSDPKPSSWIIVMEPDSIGAQGVCIDFIKLIATVKIWVELQ